MSRCLISVLLVGSVALSDAVEAQDFPARPVRIVTAAIGGTTDLVARVIAQGLTVSLGQQVIVDNRPTGIIPGETVVKAPPDGYTLLFHASSLWMMPILQKVPFDPVKDLAPIVLATSTPYVVVVHPAVRPRRSRSSSRSPKRNRARSTTVRERRARRRISRRSSSNTWRR
jgi:tripartite-type tricarboxylate transporter receptor subunit TctC